MLVEVEPVVVLTAAETRGVLVLGVVTTGTVSVTVGVVLSVPTVGVVVVVVVVVVEPATPKKLASNVIGF